jgi:hypothetical protein
MTAATNGSDGRDARGRFVKGNGGGPGNPFARRMAQLRKILLGMVTDQQMENIAMELVVKAQNGDMAAIKLLFQYVLGKPGGPIDPDAEDLRDDEPAAVSDTPVASNPADEPGPMQWIEEVCTAMGRALAPHVRKKVAEGLVGQATPAAGERAPRAAPRPKLQADQDLQSGQRPPRRAAEAAHGPEGARAGQATPAVDGRQPPSRQGPEPQPTISDRRPSRNGDNGAEQRQRMPR